MTHEEKVKNIMKHIHFQDEADTAAIQTAIMEELRRSYREGFFAGREDNRSREYNSRYGHDMGQ